MKIEKITIETLKKYLIGDETQKELDSNCISSRISDFILNQIIFLMLKNAIEKIDKERDIKINYFTYNTIKLWFFKTQIINVRAFVEEKAKDKNKSIYSIISLLEDMKSVYKDQEEDLEKLRKNIKEKTEVIINLTNKYIVHYASRESRESLNSENISVSFENLESFLRIIIKTFTVVNFMIRKTDYSGLTPTGFMYSIFDTKNRKGQELEEIVSGLFEFGKEDNNVPRKYDMKIQEWINEVRDIHDIIN